MKLQLTRFKFGDDYTIGRLSIDGKVECFTLEDQVREDGEKKVYGKTAIPRGTYKVVIDLSQRFKRLMPLLMDVPNFSGIRIHSGNTVLDTLGCILVGTGAFIDSGKLLESRKAFNKLFGKLERALERGEEIQIEILHEREEKKAA